MSAKWFNLFSGAAIQLQPQHSEQRRGEEVGDKGNDRGRKSCDGHIKLSTQLSGRVSAALGMKTLNPTVVGRVVTHSFSSPPT